MIMQNADKRVLQTVCIFFRGCFQQGDVYRRESYMSIFDNVTPLIYGTKPSIVGTKKAVVFCMKQNNSKICTKK